MIVLEFMHVYGSDVICGHAACKFNRLWRVAGGGGWLGLVKNFTYFSLNIPVYAHWQAGSI